MLSAVKILSCMANQSTLWFSLPLSAIHAPVAETAIDHGGIFLTGTVSLCIARPGMKPSFHLDAA
jgi:hypothetical protein